MFEIDTKNHKEFVNPIIFWTRVDEWEYIRERNIPYCSLYDEGFKRVGCVMCPLAKTEQMLKEAERWPRYKNMYLKAFEKAIINKPKPNQFKTAQDMYDWWVNGGHKKDDLNQAEMF